MLTVYPRGFALSLRHGFRATRETAGWPNAAVSNAIRTAVGELVAEKGSERVTIPMVAERAGVNPTTVYRRWPDAATMINDLATYRLDPDRPLPNIGDLRSDIVAWAGEVPEPLPQADQRRHPAWRGHVAGDDESIACTADSTKPRYS